VGEEDEHTAFGALMINQSASIVTCWFHFNIAFWAKSRCTQVVPLNSKRRFGDITFAGKRKQCRRLKQNKKGKIGEVYSI